MSKYRPILHVEIIDDLTGDQLADVDAASTADALAYYLRSRRIDETATEASVKNDVWFARGKRASDRQTIVRDERNIFGGIERALVARVH